MLQRIYLAIAGCATDPPEERLTAYGAKETVTIANDLRKTGHMPSVIFTDGALSAVQSAHVLGGALGVFNIVHDERLAPPYRDDDPFGRKPDPLRKRFRSPQSARRFLSEVYKLKAGDETVVFMTDHCWGLTFGGSWPRSKLGRFNLDTQTLDFVAYHGNRI